MATGPLRDRYRAGAAQFLCEKVGPIRLAPRNSWGVAHQLDGGNQVALGKANQLVWISYGQSYGGPPPQAQRKVEHFGRAALEEVQVSVVRAVHQCIARRDLEAPGITRFMIVPREYDCDVADPMAMSLQAPRWAPLAAESGMAAA